MASTGTSFSSAAFIAYLIMDMSFLGDGVLSIKFKCSPPVVNISAFFFFRRFWLGSAVAWFWMIFSWNLSWICRSLEG